MQNHNNPIGIFDSGVGGLTVWDKIRLKLPNENIIYLADSANCPYGNKPETQIIEHSINNTEFLLSKGCKLIIVACNTATAAAIETLRTRYNVPFVGMEPAIKTAALNSQTGKIGILATKGTFNGQLFKKTSAKYASHLETIIQIGEGLVEIVENGELETSKAFETIKQHIQPMLAKGVDKIVLGCTHYPFFKDKIENIAGNQIDVIDPAPAIANRTLQLLNSHKLLRTTSTIGTMEFYTNGDTAILKNLVKYLSHLDIEVTKIN